MDGQGDPGLAPTANTNNVHHNKVKPPSVLEKLKSDKAYRGRVIQSLRLALSSLTLGVVFGQQGPAFLDLQIITNTDVETASAFFTSASCGYMVGSFISGFVHTKINNNVLMTIVNAGAGAASIITPHCSPYYLMIIIRFTTNMFCGGIDTLVNAEHMHIWGSEGRSLLQLIHFTFAFGGVLTPLFTEPFLAPKEIKNSNTEAQIFEFNMTSSELTLNITSNLTSNTSNNNTTVLLPRTTNVHYAFLIGGVISILISLHYVVTIFCEKKSKSSSDTHTQSVHDRKLPRPLYVFLILVLCFFYLVYCCVEDTFASFLMTFVVTEYDSVSKSEGAYITTFYWGSFAVGRFLSIFVSKYITAMKVVFIYTLFMIVAFAGFTISATFGHIGLLTTFSCMAGLSLSAVFAAGFSWTEAELLKVTGWVSSFILIGSSIGMMINPLIIGYLMENVSNMWFCYILLAETLLLCCVFYFLLLFNRCYINKCYGTIGEGRSLEIYVEPPKNETELNLMGNVD
ncbi:unnamed protein product [Lymnaea stagnalis]|uniref:Sodium-dependent glucose transporter 1 n=1 Tax=Lymnaea stagnalis TaxID=6523 RepID=A0AAV2I4D2_LYMST